MSDAAIVEPFLFSTRPDLVAATCDRRRPRDEQVAAVVVDWERRGKAARQAGAARRIGTDTEIGAATPGDLARVRAAVQVPVICRINATGPRTRHEVELALRLGADEILVPMIRTVAHVDVVLRLTAGRAGVGIMVETSEAVEQAARLARLPITRAYMGLMDLALDRGSPSIFSALEDGTVERVRDRFSVPFGFGGMTVPGGGAPVPVDLFLAEMARLGCGFSFLRRSFIADVAGREPGHAVAAIRRAAHRAAQRSPAVVEADHADLLELVRGLSSAAVSAPLP